MGPAVSPDGLRIAYHHNDDIWVADSDGGNPVNLTQSAQPEAFPAWSPDGARIVYARNDDLWVTDADGSNQQPLGIKGLRPSWSPDGCCIAFQAGALFLDIVTANSDGAVQTTMVGDNWINEAPAWSPLGNLIAYNSNKDGSTHVFVVDRPGGEPVNMTIALTSHAVHPTWAPDAEAGAFESNASGNWDIYYFDPDTSLLVQLTTNWASDLEPSWGGGN
jgi:TolB protein